MPRMVDPDLSSPAFKADPFSMLRGPVREALSRNMLDLDEPDHRRLRTLVQKAFTPGVVAAMRARIESIADELLDRISRQGQTFDLIRDYASPIPITVIAELLGVAADDREKFHRWSSAIVAADTSEPQLLPTAIEEMLRFESPLQLATERYATEDVTIRGATIDRGAMVYVALASANRD